MKIMLALARKFVVKIHTHKIKCKLHACSDKHGKYCGDDYIKKNSIFRWWCVML